MPRKTGVLGSQDIVGIARRHHFRAYEQGWSTPIIGPGFRTLTLDYMQPARVCKLAYHQSTLPLAQMKVLPPSQNVFHRAHLTYSSRTTCGTHSDKAPSLSPSMNFSKHLAMFIYVYADIAMKSWCWGISVVNISAF
ncbi:hypothetical protein PCH_Pc22g04030 [Penicillium rubens Wisconsin 54-1255]|uniref:Uncharacterized protein n=1 Tax=Penicillium rubens (strain ATCC 28089 / DSM 1075 / NRRL 1951 / Wisconsin 54-1255) TaxID=500485 RepID=B6HSL7_PENRW|nr:hypothetical protein PCH_Pc22g04030 [Penicillium rubens Wisconsin 54-1255]